MFIICSCIFVSFVTIVCIDNEWTWIEEKFKISNRQFHGNHGRFYPPVKEVKTGRLKGRPFSIQLCPEHILYIHTGKSITWHPCDVMLCHKNKPAFDKMSRSQLDMMSGSIFYHDLGNFDLLWAEMSL
jgi:hypothetical protein